MRLKVNRYIIGLVSKKKKNLHGLRPATFPRSVRWRVDQDYTDKLSPEDRQFLAEFNDAYYGADFRGTDPDDWGPEERRERYRAKNAANRDLYSSGMVDFWPDGNPDKNDREGP